MVLIVVESLSAKFLGAFGNADRLTPNLDRLAQQGLVFTNLRATGTRTVRGLEAITLSVPPTPGYSIVKRPHNSNLFSLGSVLREHGYSTRFFYGGYSYFDNMGPFFAGNGFDVIDRTRLSGDEVGLRERLGRRRRVRAPPRAARGATARTKRASDSSRSCSPPRTTGRSRIRTGRIDIPPATAARAR